MRLFFPILIALCVVRAVETPRVLAEEDANGTGNFAQLQEKIDAARKSGRPVPETLIQQYDQAFSVFITNTAPAARYSTGWPGGNQGPVLFAKLIKEFRQRSSKLSELEVLLRRMDSESDPQKRELLNQQMRGLCRAVGDLTLAKVSGLSQRESDALKSGFREGESVEGLLRCVAYTHLAIAKHQSRDSKSIEALEAVLLEVERNLGSESRLASDPSKIMSQLIMLGRGCLVQTVLMEQEMNQRSRLEEMVAGRMNLRRWLIASQCFDICDARVRIAVERDQPKAVWETLTQQRSIANNARAEYSVRMKGSPGNLLRECDWSRREIRHTQEAKDKTGFTVSTYAVNQEKIGRGHIRTAIEILDATNDQPVVQKLSPLVNDLPE
ncbi:hypothetical protein [Rhodopirellula bahusiensis]|uniref:hypothetical protein n=1 Tax=Rhodopirellula bahusiensis TaxID=2014065 RepID=UPI0032673186